MMCKDIIISNLSFLEYEYGFSCSYIFKNGNFYTYSNQYGQIDIFEYDKFRMRRITVKYDEEFKFWKFALKYNKKKVIDSNYYEKKLKPILFDSLKDPQYDDHVMSTKEYYEKLATAIKNEISKTGTIFGLKIQCVNS